MVCGALRKRWFIPNPATIAGMMLKRTALMMIDPKDAPKSSSKARRRRSGKEEPQLAGSFMKWLSETRWNAGSLQTGGGSRGQRPLPWGPDVQQTRRSHSPRLRIVCDCGYVGWLHHPRSARAHAAFAMFKPDGHCSPCRQSSTDLAPSLKFYLEQLQQLIQRKTSNACCESETNYRFVHVAPS